MKGTEKQESRQADSVLEELFRHAKARERPPRDAERAIRESLHTEWKAGVKERRRKRRRVWLAAAASLAVAVVAGAILLQPRSLVEDGIRVAVVEVLVGVVSTRYRGGEQIVLAASNGLATGQEVSTARDAGVSLRWRSDISLRLDQNSRIRILSPTELELLAGSIYVDTDAAGRQTELSLSTPAGKVRHLGTRYMVSVQQGATSVSVREGQVQLDGSETAAPGERIVVYASGDRRRETIAVYGDDWQWAERLAAPFDSDGRTLAEFFDWIERESGRRVDFASPAAERLAAESRLRGVVDLEPMQALALVMQTTDLEYEVVDGTVVVTVRAER